jgi:Raf kinase inhibitor-like YbhB/YbcL family protein
VENPDTESREERKALASALVSAMLLIIPVAAVLAGCSDAADLRGAASLELKSTSFFDNTIPAKNSSCGGQDGASPKLSWSSPPKRTQSFALIASDKDSPFGFKLTQWVLYDIPPDKGELAEDLAKQEQLPDGSRQGINDYDRIGCVGPCPPHRTHHYVFTLYALDTTLNLSSRTSKKQVVKAMKGHVLAGGELTERFPH